MDYRKGKNRNRKPRVEAGWKPNGKDKLDPGLSAAEKRKLTVSGGAISKATTPNPKDLFGSVKVSFTKVSAIALAHCAMAMMDGARKYGPYNWRAKPVIISIYIDAAMRHMLSFWEGERVASDSKVHHLGHAMACCAILLDAEAHGCLIDDRPDGKAVLSKLLDELSATLKAGNEERAAAAKLESDLNLAPGSILRTVARKKARR